MHARRRQTDRRTNIMERMHRALNINKTRLLFSRRSLSDLELFQQCTHYYATFVIHRPNGSDVAMITSRPNVTSRYRGPKRKRSCRPLVSVITTLLCCSPIYASLFYAANVIFFIVECGIARFLCTMRVFDVRASSSSLGYPCAKFRSFVASIAELTYGEKSRTQ